MGSQGADPHWSRPAAERAPALGAARGGHGLPGRGRPDRLRHASSHLLPVQLSSATIRNTLAELRSSGWSSQPHTRRRPRADRAGPAALRRRAAGRDLLPPLRAARRSRAASRTPRATAPCTSPRSCSRSARASSASWWRRGSTASCCATSRLVRLASDRLLVGAGVADGCRLPPRDRGRRLRATRRSSTGSPRCSASASPAARWRRCASGSSQEAAPAAAAGGTRALALLELGLRALASPEPAEADVVIETRLALLGQPEFQDPRRLRERPGRGRDQGAAARAARQDARRRRRARRVRGGAGRAGAARLRAGRAPLRRAGRAAGRARRDRPEPDGLRAGDPAGPIPLGGDHGEALRMTTRPGKKQLPKLPPPEPGGGGLGVPRRGEPPGGCWRRAPSSRRRCARPRRPSPSPAPRAAGAGRARAPRRPPRRARIEDLSARAGRDQGSPAPPPGRLRELPQPRAARARGGAPLRRPESLQGPAVDGR